MIAATVFAILETNRAYTYSVIEKDLPGSFAGWIRFFNATKHGKEEVMRNLCRIGSIFVLLIVLLAGCEELIMPNLTVPDDAALVVQAGDDFAVTVIHQTPAAKAIGDNEVWQYRLNTEIRSEETNDLLFQEAFALKEEQINNGYQLIIIAPVGGPYVFTANVENANHVILKTGTSDPFSVADAFETAKPQFNWDNGPQGSLALEIPPMDITLGVTVYDFDGNLHGNSNVRIYDSDGVQLYSVCTNQFLAAVWEDSAVYGLSYFNLEPGTYRVESYLSHSAAYKQSKEITLNRGDTPKTMDFRYSTTDCMITIYNSANKELVDFPVKVQLNSDNFFFAKTTTTGNDLRFHNSNDAELAYWIQSWNKNNCDAVIWVKIPAISANDTVTICMDYGDHSLAAVSSAPDVLTGFWSYSDFTGWSDNWGSPVKKYSTGSYQMMGGYSNYGSGAYTQYRFDDLPADNYAFTFDFYFWDSWDNEWGRLYANNSLIWQKQSVHNGSEGNLGNQGGGGWNDRLVRDNLATLNHGGGDLTIRFTSTLNQHAWDESFGVNNIAVRKIVDPEPAVNVYK
jgi:hypothetical protein